VRGRTVRCWLAMLAIALVGCAEGPSSGDQAGVARLRGQFVDQYEFQFDDSGPYLIMRATGPASPDKKDAIRAVKEFWLASGERRTDSRYVYLNLYGRDGTFQIQFYIDPKTGEIEQSMSEHY